MRAANFVFSLIVLLTLQAARAYTRAELEGAVADLHQQLDKLDGQNPRSCAQDHKPIFSGDSVKVALYYGYEDSGDITLDSVHARALSKVLQEPCTPNLEVCGFNQVSKTENMTRLQKTIRGQKVIVSIYSTSVSSSNEANMGRLSSRQRVRSQKIIQQFHRDLVESDIVFYAGHSRMGSGLGFSSQTTGQTIFEYLTRIPLRPMMKALEARPSRLKVLGLFSCESDKYYRAAIEARNPRVNMFVTADDIFPDEGEQMSLGALNSILARKCEPELRDSLLPALKPDHRSVNYIRRPF